MATENNQPKRPELPPVRTMIQSKSQSLSPQKSDLSFIDECQSIKNIKNALEFYDQLSKGEKISQDEDILQYFDQHPTIINDYHYIILHYLSTGNRQQDNKNFNIIDNILREAISCDITNCMNYKRNHRNRNKDTNKSKNNDKDKEYEQEQLMNATFKLEHKGHPDAVFYKQFLDSIHCYFIHAADVGFRINIDDDINEDEVEGKVGKIDLDSSELYQDTQIKNIQDQIHNKRKKLQSLGRVQYNKFNTEISLVFV